MTDTTTAAGRLRARLTTSPHPLLTDDDFADIQTVLRDHAAMATELANAKVSIMLFLARAGGTVTFTEADMRRTAEWIERNRLATNGQESTT